ncbi:hypothetical protein [Dinoroseobacter sp. S76]|uniref:hypothetical protein n=1 Tax=Dinoroseobacter sp. S76 TaxID=3415124 RepID=UPI003C7CE17F
MAHRNGAKNQPGAPIPGSKLPIQVSVELLFIAVFLLAVVCLPLYSSTAAFLLGIIAIFSSLNAWLTARAEFSYFITIWFVLDLFLIVFYAAIPSLLLQGNEYWGYSPYFWLMLSGIEAVYTLWNYLFNKFRGSLTDPPHESAKELNMWMVRSIIAVILNLGIFWFLFSVEAGLKFNFSLSWVAFISETPLTQDHIGFSLMVLGGMYMVYLEGLWNIRRYRDERSAGRQPWLD